MLQPNERSFLNRFMRRNLYRRGWYVRKALGLPFGVDLLTDIGRLGKCDPQKMIVFDVGAFEGWFSSKILEIFPATTVFCFEPNPEAFERLRTRLGGYANAFPIPAGVGAQDGKKKLYFHKESPVQNSMIFDKRYNSAYDSENALDVQLIKIDSFCSMKDVSSIDLLKIDAEGCEIDIIDGSKELLSSGNCNHILAEFVFEYHRSPNTKFENLSSALKNYEFYLTTIYNECVSKEGKFIYGSALFTKEKSN